VRFLGFVPRSDLVMLYRHAFALAYVTFFGPENLPPLEVRARVPRCRLRRGGGRRATRRLRAPGAAHR
jgi:hypothetical protein